MAEKVNEYLQNYALVTQGSNALNEVKDVRAIKTLETIAGEDTPPVESKEKTLYDTVALKVQNASKYITDYIKKNSKGIISKLDEKTLQGLLLKYSENDSLKLVHQIGQAYQEKDIEKLRELITKKYKGAKEYLSVASNEQVLNTAGFYLSKISKEAQDTTLKPYIITNKEEKTSKFNKSKAQDYISKQINKNENLITEISSLYANQLQESKTKKAA